MTGRHKSQIDEYLDALRGALRRRGVSDERIVLEVREHLADAAERARQDGQAEATAQQEAIARFGSPQTVAMAFAADRGQMFDVWLLVAALAIGGVIAYVDARPTWDDTGITAGSLLLSAAALSYFARRRAWLLAITMGVWIPLLSIVRRPEWRDVFMFAVLLFPLTGALLGRALRRFVSTADH